MNQVHWRFQLYLLHLLTYLENFNYLNNFTMLQPLNISQSLHKSQISRKFKAFSFCQIPTKWNCSLFVSFFHDFSCCEAGRHSQARLQSLHSNIFHQLFFWRGAKSWWKITKIQISNNFFVLPSDWRLQRVDFVLSKPLQTCFSTFSLMSIMKTK